MAALATSNMLVLRPVTALADATRCLGEGHLGARTGLPHAAEELGQIAHLRRNGRVAGTAGRFPTHGSPGQGITQTILQPPDAGANPRARRRGTASRPLAPDQLGRIVVARFLELPLRTFERRACALEQAPCFQALRPLVRLGSLSGQPSLAAESSRITNLLAVIQPASDGVVFRYTNPAFDREYRFEEAAQLLSWRKDSLWCVPTGHVARGVPGRPWGNGSHMGTTPLCTPSREEKLGEQPVDPLWGPDVGSMSATRNDLQSAVREEVRDGLDLQDRQRDVGVTVDEQRRTRHLRQDGRGEGPVEFALLGDQHNRRGIERDADGHHGVTEAGPQHRRQGEGQDEERERLECVDGPHQFD